MAKRFLYVIYFEVAIHWYHGSQICSAAVAEIDLLFRYKSFSRLLLDSGADTHILTDEGERPVDLVDPGDMRTIAVMLGPLEKKKR